MSDDQYNQHDPNRGYGQSYDSEQYARQQYGVPGPAQAHDPYQQPYQEPSYREPANNQDAQTWQGQTWDTQYQPQVQYQQPRQPQQPQQPNPHQAAADTAYLPQQSGAYPLPPEVPAAGQAP
ncbi:hypothetical protein P3L51_14315, partial [Streptomyces sp. PSRA5]